MRVKRRLLKVAGSRCYAKFFRTTTTTCSCHTYGPVDEDDTTIILSAIFGSLFISEQMEGLGANVELCDIGKQTLSDGSIIKFPPVLFGTPGNDKAKKTLLIDGHLNIQPAEKLEIQNLSGGELCECGSTDDKGPVVAWINALETLYKSEIPIRVNIKTPFMHSTDLKFCFEAMEESGSLGLEEILENKDTFLNNFNFTCISDSYWLGKTKPCISYDLRPDLHSGIFGGSVYEPMADLVWVISQLTDVEGNILIQDIMNLVTPVTNEERKLYETLDFGVIRIIYCHCGMRLNHFLIVQEEYRADIGAIKLLSDSKEKILMKRWRYLTLSLHGIVGASSGEDAKWSFLPK
ncbi:Uncharacterized protein BM_BM7073 [Brugia malayi]|uniref:BMA-PES-9 n=1 Tax=Brugia malayi TaxID=6279 RepID=A0A0K0JQT9_BRUMA|nr:Uncharacterized protein BM_BM7073 [Brugia malayi]CRZ21706.1 BMA-PES-9 [Brugia malayi]VIO87242.1 Uncharacterized protein BM_BM7073 [Brugia malayi]